MKNKRCMRVLALALAIMALVGCKQVEQAEPVDIAQVQKQLLEAAPGLPDMICVNSTEESGEKLFGYLSDMDYGLVESYFLAYSSQGLADEIAVICVKDASQAAQAEKSLRAHVADRENLYRNYAPEQLSRVEDALVFTSGNYAVLIICEEAQAVKQAFQAATGG